MGYPTFIRTKQTEAVKPHASFLFPALDLLGVLMDLNVPKVGFWTVSEYMTRVGAAYIATTGYSFLSVGTGNGTELMGTSKAKERHCATADKGPRYC